jgi:hypothetical protein
MANRELGTCIKVFRANAIYTVGYAVIAVGLLVPPAVMVPVAVKEKKSIEDLLAWLAFPLGSVLLLCSAWRHSKTGLEICEDGVRIKEFFVSTECAYSEMSYSQKLCIAE